MKTSLLLSLCLASIVNLTPLPQAMAISEIPSMLGNQSQNSGLRAVPAKGAVKIDGNLDDWDLSGRIWSFADVNLREEYSVETAAMWDADYLYLALKWKDPTPLHNLIDPKFNPQDGWKSDAVQMRIRTDQTLWLTAWKYTDGGANVLIDYWKNEADPKNGTTSREFFGESGEVNLGEGIQMAFASQPGGYVQEIRIPWKLLFKETPKIAAGEKIRIGFEYIWGDATGKKWPGHRYADNMQPGATDREFFWTAQKAWGDVELMSAGNLPMRQYRPASAALAGPVEFTLSLPTEAKRFTAVIENEKGQRVRNLVADSSPADFAIGDSGKKVELQLAWDGANDEGLPVEPGKYQVRGLWHTGLDAIYDITFYNPGTPQWQTADGSGAWGADHYPPRGVVAAGDWMILSWDFAEGGSGIIGVGADGRKKWGENRGSLTTAANNEHVFSIMSGWHGSGNLCRYDKLTGAYAPFVFEGKTREFEVPLASVIPNAPAPEKFRGVEDTKDTKAFVNAMAADATRLVLATSDNRIVVLDANSAQLLNEFPAKNVSAIAFGPNDTFYAISEGALNAIDLKTGKVSAIATLGLIEAGALAVNGRGEIAIMDLGPDDQVKLFSPKGKFLSAIGKKGGRPIRGTFVPEALSHVSSIAFDAAGNLWAVENWNFPRRVSVWAPDGKLVRDYVGNTGYSGAGAYLHPEDPSIAYVGPVELKLDREKRTSQVTRILWKADETRADEPMSFDLNVDSNIVGQRFCSSASGQLREYLFKQPVYVRAEPSVLFMENEDGSWRPVSAVGLVGQISGSVGSKGREVIELPSGEFAGLNVWDGFFWNDENGDGRVQRSECVIVPSSAPGKVGDKAPTELPIPMGATWNNTMDPSDLSYYTTGIHRIKPVRFTKAGAPIYGPEGIEKVADVKRLGLKEAQWLNPVVTGDKSRTIGLQTLYAWGDAPAFIGLDAKSQEVQWTYPNRYPGVHASHKAPMPKPGLVIGPLKVSGTAKVNDEVGEVMALRGNLGQDFFFTTDGLNIGALFRDTRYPSGTLPPSESEIRGKSLASLSEGSEPFSGWFGKQADGKIRMTMSIAREAALVVEVKGLDSVHRFTGPELTLTPADLEKAAAAREASQIQPARAIEPYRIQRVAAALPLEGAAEAWKNIPALEIRKEGSPEKANVQLASDGQTLFVRAAVTDASPMQNEGKDFTRLFKTGDAVDLQFGPAEPERKEPGKGDSRVVLSFLENKPVAILMRPIDESAPKSVAKTYVSPVGPKSFDRVEKMVNAKVAAKAVDGGYLMIAAIPLAELGITPTSGLKLRGDVGFISSDSSGKRNIARTYWANQDTALVSDEPQESWIFPAQWSEFIVE